MRLVILFAFLVLAANATAEEKPTEAKDETANQLHAEGVVHRDIATRNCNRADDDCDSAVDEKTAPANHNTTRSNRTLRATPPSNQGATGATRAPANKYNSSRSNISATKPELDSDGGETRAQDYNSSRSNTTSLRLDDDSDGDSLEEVRCSMRSDDCVTDSDDQVVRKKPGKK